MALVIQNLHKSFDGYVALDRINLSIENAEFVCLLGPSGCGKTTLLRIIAGLLSCDGGKITLDDRDLVNVPARERGFGIVFQSYSLFPHMTNVIPTSFQEDSSSVSLLHARWRSTLLCYYWMNRSRHWMRACAPDCVRNYAMCSSGSVFRP